MTLALVLAAGGGSRFDAARHKLLTPLRGRPVVAWAVGAAVASGLPVLVVTGAVDLAAALPEGVATRHNPDWASGQATSLQAGLRLAGGHDAVVVGLGDQPFVEADAWRLVAEGSTPIVVATYQGERGNPVRLAAEVWPLLPTAGDEGARPLMRERPELVSGVACPGNPADIDTVGDLERWS